MISKDLSLKLQAQLDGELPPAEAAEVARLVAANPEAAALQRELSATREVLKGSELTVPVPETREFYWSKIARGIEQAEREPVRSTRISPWAWLTQRLVPLTVVVLVAGLLTVAKFNGMWITSGQRMALLHEIETPVEDTGVLEFHDAKTGITVVWLDHEIDHD